jgi:hypothetical protein
MMHAYCKAHSVRKRGVKRKKWGPGFEGSRGPGDRRQKVRGLAKYLII